MSHDESLGCFTEKIPLLPVVPAREVASSVSTNSTVNVSFVYQQSHYSWLLLFGLVVTGYILLQKIPSPNELAPQVIVHDVGQLSLAENLERVEGDLNHILQLLEELNRLIGVSFDLPENWAN